MKISLKLLWLVILLTALLPVRQLADTYDKHTLVAITTAAKEDVQLLYDCHVDIVGRRGDVYKALLTDEQLQVLSQKNLTIEILYAEMAEDRRLWKEADEASAALLATAYYTASKFNTTNPPAGSLMEHMLQQYNAHQSICRLYNLGATQDGAYDIIAMKITKNPDVVEAEPKIRIYGNIHGDEKIGCMVACDVLDTILAGYTAVPQDPTAKKLVDESEMWFIPMGNPYGNAHNSRYNSRSVDCNRNFWGPAGSGDGYPSAAPWTEKETQAIRDLTEAATADHSKKRFAVSISFHSGDECFNSVWNYSATAPADEPIFWASRTPGSGCSDQNGCLTLAPHGLAQAYKDGCTQPGFWFTDGYDWYQTLGDTNDWAYGAWTSLDTTVELDTTKTPAVGQIDVDCGYHRQAVLNYMMKAFQGIHGVMTDAGTGSPLDGTVTATCTASATIPVPHAYQAIYTDPVAGDFHRVLQPGTYTVACNCAGYPTTTITGVAVTADTKTMVNCAMGTGCANNPTAVSVTPNGPLTLCPGTGQVLTATPTGGVGNTYQWTMDGADITGATSSTYTANDSATHGYNCKVKGSGCATAFSDAAPTQITWQSAPAFAGAVSVATPGDATCKLNVTWAAASSACPGTITYSIYRSTSSPVSINPGNLKASGLTGTTYTDSDNLVNATTYYYVVRATDGIGQQDGNTVEKSGVPVGPASLGTFFAGAETGNAAMTYNAPWHTSSVYKRTGTSSYSTNTDSTTYPNSACGGLTTPSLTLGTSSVLTYYGMWSTETGYDGGRVEISTNGGSSWAALTPTPAYTGAITGSGNSCSWATGTLCYIGSSTGYPATWQLATIALSAYNNQTVLLRWNFTSDGSLCGNGANPGWYIDDINITNVMVPGTCTTAASGSPRVPYTVSPTKITTGNHGTDGTVTFDKNNCSSTNYHVIYGKGENLAAWTVDGGKCTIGATGNYTWSSIPDPSSYTKRFLWFLVVGDNGSSTEGSWGLTYPDGAEEGGTNACNVCSMTTKNTTATCGTP